MCPVCNKATMYTEFSPTALYTQLQYLQHVLDLPKMRERAEEQNEFRNNLSQVCIVISLNNRKVSVLIFVLINCNLAGENRGEVCSAEGAVGGEILEEQRLRHSDALQAV